jgi:hypothetical protein
MFSSKLSEIDNQIAVLFLSVMDEAMSILQAEEAATDATSLST